MYDISLALFGSSLLAFIIAFLEYFSQKKEKLSCFYNSAYTLSEELAKLYYYHIDGNRKEVIERVEENYPDILMTDYQFLQDDKDLSHCIDKLIVGVLSKEPMYAMDTNDILIASGGTAGYCAVSKKDASPYALEYIQAWLSNSITERILEIVGSDFEGGFIARGTFVLSTLPFVELDFNVPEQKKIYDRVVAASREIYEINDGLSNRPAKRVATLLQKQKEILIQEIQELIEKVYRLEF